jgi:membrane fusion protein (multidrug efflux system)
MDDQEYIKLNDEIQRLRDEQQRLRDEQEKLRRQSHEKDNSKDEDGDDGDKDDSKEESEGSKNDTDGEDKKDGKEDEDEKHKRPFKERVRGYVAAHPARIVLFAIGLVVLCILCVLLILYIKSYESTDDAEVDGHLNAVASRVNGTVTNVYVEDDQTVTVGQPLVDLDQRDYGVMLEQANASYAAAQAQLNAENPNVPIVQTSNETNISTSQSGVQSAQASVEAANQKVQAKKAALSQAEANSVKAQKDVERYKLLVGKEEISRQQFDAAVAQAKTTAAAVDAADDEVKAAGKNVDQALDQLSQAHARLAEANRNAPRSVAIRQASVRAREASVLNAKAQVDAAQLNLSYTKIFAPVGGIVGEKSVEIGDRIEIGQQLMIISQTGDIWITANFKETQLKKMHAGQHVEIKVDAFGVKYHGYVESMPGATGAKTSLLPPENATGNYVKVVQRLPVRIRLNQGEDPDHRLRPGMSVEPKVWLK